MLVLFGIMPVLRSSVLDLLDQIQGVLVVLRPTSELKKNCLVFTWLYAQTHVIS
jgi:hypothetical protein